MTVDSHWVNWHRMYEIDGSPLNLRLEIVQRHVRDELSRRGAAETRIVSLCAGQGRDVIGALVGNPAAGAVRARLVELDPQLVADVRAAATEAGVDGGVEIVEGDASTSDCLAGAVPADVVLACGIFGNISNDDIRGFVSVLPTLCSPGAPCCGRATVARRISRPTCVHGLSMPASTRWRSSHPTPPVSSPSGCTVWRSRRNRSGPARNGSPSSARAASSDPS